MDDFDGLDVLRIQVIDLVHRIHAPVVDVNDGRALPDDGEVVLSVHQEARRFAQHVDAVRAR